MSRSPVRKPPRIPDVSRFVTQVDAELGHSPPPSCASSSVRVLRLEGRERTEPSDRRMGFSRRTSTILAMVQVLEEEGYEIADRRFDRQPSGASSGAFRGRERSRERSRDRGRDRSRERSRERSRDRSRERSRERSRDRGRERSRDREITHYVYHDTDRSFAGDGEEVEVIREVVQPEIVRATREREPNESRRTRVKKLLVENGYYARKANLRRSAGGERENIDIIGRKEELLGAQAIHQTVDGMNGRQCYQEIRMKRKRSRERSVRVSGHDPRDYYRPRRPEEEVETPRLLPGPFTARNSATSTPEGEDSITPRIGLLTEDTVKKELTGVKIAEKSAQKSNKKDQQTQMEGGYAPNYFKQSVDIATQTRVQPAKKDAGAQSEAITVDGAVKIASVYEPIHRYRKGADGVVETTQTTLRGVNANRSLSTNLLESKKTTFKAPKVHKLEVTYLPSKSVISTKSKAQPPRVEASTSTEILRTTVKKPGLIQGRRKPNPEKTEKKIKIEKMQKSRDLSQNRPSVSPAPSVKSVLESSSRALRASHLILERINKKKLQRILKEHGGSKQADEANADTISKAMSTKSGKLSPRRQTYSISAMDPLNPQKMALTPAKRRLTDNTANKPLQQPKEDPLRDTSYTRVQQREARGRLSQITSETQTGPDGVTYTQQKRSKEVYMKRTSSTLIQNRDYHCRVDQKKQAFYAASGYKQRVSANQRECRTPNLMLRGTRTATRKVETAQKTRTGLANTQTAVEHKQTAIVLRDSAAPGRASTNGAIRIHGGKAALRSSSPDMSSPTRTRAPNGQNATKNGTKPRSSTHHHYHHHHYYHGSRSGAESTDPGTAFQPSNSQIEGLLDGSKQLSEDMVLTSTFKTQSEVSFKIERRANQSRRRAQDLGSLGVRNEQEGGGAAAAHSRKAIRKRQEMFIKSEYELVVDNTTIPEAPPSPGSRPSLFDDYYRRLYGAKKIGQVEEKPKYRYDGGYSRDKLKNDRTPSKVDYVAGPDFKAKQVKKAEVRRQTEAARLKNQNGGADKATIAVCYLE